MLYSGHARVIILLEQVIDPVSMLGLLIDVQPALGLCWINIIKIL